MVGGLELLDRRGVPPDHDVGVAPQACHVVDPTDRDTLARDRVEEGLQLVGELVTVVAEGVTLANTDHIE